MEFGGNPRWETAPVAADRESFGPMLQYRLFGGVAAVRAGVEVDVGGPKPRAVLAMLLIEVGRPVSVDRIIDAVWEDDPPARAEISVRGYVSNLRKALGGEPDLIVWREGSYRLRASGTDLDTGRFEALVARGTEALRVGDHAAARARLSQALTLWTGEPFGALGDLHAVRDAAFRLRERRYEAQDSLIDTRLALGEHHEIVGDLVAAVAAEPLRERRRAQLALALYRSGRAVDALRSIEDARRVLADDVGVALAPNLVELERSILDHDDGLAWRPPGPEESDGVDDVGRDDRQRDDRDPPFVGRQRALETVREALSMVGGEAGSYAGHVIVVSGEAGIGKTALVTEAASSPRLTRPIFWARCSEATIAAPLRPWRTLAARVEHLTGDASLSTALQQHGDPMLDPLSGRLGVHAAIAEALRVAGPLVIVFDDLQWADDASLALLELLAEDLADLPVVLLTTLRTPVVAPSTALVDCLGSIARSPRFVRLVLEGLDEADVARWITHTIGESRAEAVAPFVYERTEGNPFFVQEVVALIVAEGRPEAPLDRSVPASIQDAIRRRTSRLPPITQRTLSAAAVLGRSFDADLVAPIVESALSEVLSALMPALDAGLVTEDPGRPGRYAFAHALVPETLLLEQNAVRRGELHARATRALEQRRPLTDTTVDEIARHAYAGAAAGTAHAAVDYSVRAADLARASFADGVVAIHLEHALHALDLSAAPDHRRRLGLLIDLGIARGNSGDITGARDALADAAQLAVDLGDVDAMATALIHVNVDDLWSSLDWAQHDARTLALIDRALDLIDDRDSAARAGLLAAKAAQLYYLDTERADALSATAVDVARRVGEPMTLARVLVQRYWAMWRPSGNAARSETAAALLALTNTHPLPPAFTPLAHLACFSAAYEVGDRDASERALAGARAAADPVRTASAWTYVLYAEVSGLLLRGSFVDAERSIGEAYDAFRRTRRVVADTTRAALLAQLRAEQGATDEAVEHLEIFRTTAYAASIAWLRAWILAEGGRLDQARAELRSFAGPLPDDWYRGVVLTGAIHAAAAVGNHDFLRRHLDELEPLSGLIACAGSGGLVLGPVDLALARAYFAIGDTDRAEGRLAAALEQARALDASPWIVRCLALRHTITGDDDDRHEARRLAGQLGMHALALTI